MKNNILFTSLIFMMLLFQSCIELDSGEIGIEEDYSTGELTVYTTAGLKDWLNVMDDYTPYQKEEMYDFTENPIKIQFSDFGIGWIEGTVRYVLPQSKDEMTKLHSNYGSQEAIENELIRQAIERATYLAGPLMSSTESNAEKKPDLINYITDQAKNGVYRTMKVPTEVEDPVTRKRVIKDLPVIVECPSEDLPDDAICINGFARQEKSSVSQYRVRLADLTIKDITYDQKTKEKIAKQQEAILAVEQSIVEAQEAQQDAIKAEEQGKAKAAEAKWAEEALKAQAVTQAQKEAEVAKLSYEKEQYNRKAEEEKALGVAAQVRAGVDPETRLKLELQRDVDVAEAIAKRGVPMIVNSGDGGSSLEDAYQMKEMILLLDQLKSK